MITIGFYLVRLPSRLVSQVDFNDIFPLIHNRGYTGVTYSQRHTNEGFYCYYLTGFTASLNVLILCYFSQYVISLPKALVSSCTE